MQVAVSDAVAVWATFWQVPMGGVSSVKSTVPVGVACEETMAMKVTRCQWRQRRGRPRCRVVVAGPR